jgi:RNA polymerase sigma-70 factor (sigma-E family)
MRGREEDLPDGFSRAFDHLYEVGFRTAYRLTGDRGDSEDIAQEACARACVRWRSLRDRVDVGPWVARVSSNLAIDSWRRNERRKRHISNNNPVEVQVDADLASERRVDLHRALATLPRRQREVVVLRFVVDLSEAETAAALGCAPGTVKSHSSRGLAALRAVLGTEETV